MRKWTFVLWTFVLLSACSSEPQPGPVYEMVAPYKGKVRAIKRNMTHSECEAEAFNFWKQSEAVLGEEIAPFCRVMKD